jgi:peptide chain release factor subunit 1
VVDRLAAIGTTDHWVVSCYLKLEPRDRTRGKYLIKLKNRIKERLSALEARGVSREEFRTVARDLERVREYLENPEHLPAGRGIAIFACAPLELFDVIPLPRVFRSRLVVDHSPLVRELAAVNDEFGRLLCVVYDRTSARFFEVTAQEVVERESLAAPDATRTGRFHASSESERHRSPRGPGGQGPMGRGVGASAYGEHNFNMRIREEKQRHYAGIAEQLFRETRGTRVDGIVLAGMGKDLDAVSPHLHPYLRDEVLGTVKLNPKSVTGAQVMDAVLEVRRSREREWEARHVRELAEGLGTGWAVNGLGDTLDALARGQVRTLLVDSQASRPGFRCGDTGRLVRTAEECEAEGEPLAVADVIDDAMEDALRQDAHVDVVEDDDARQQVEEIAALLRFRLG